MSTLAQVSTFAVLALTALGCAAHASVEAPPRPPAQSAAPASTPVAASAPAPRPPPKHPNGSFKLQVLSGSSTFPPLSAVRSAPRTLTVSWLSDHNDFESSIRQAPVGYAFALAGWEGVMNPWGDNKDEYVFATMHNAHLVSLSPPSRPPVGTVEVLVISYDSVTVHHRDAKTTEEIPE